MIQVERASGAPDRAVRFVALQRARFAARDPLQEHVHAIFLDPHEGYLDDRFVASGPSAGLSLRMRTIFGRALEMGAAGLIIAHNHPSGRCRPSNGDITATRRLSEVADALDVRLVDHVILTRSAAYSMRAGGYL